MRGLTLYGYWRSSAAFRVRITLALKNKNYAYVPVHLINNGGEQHSETFHQINPQELLPVLKHGERTFRQSGAIMEYLEETYPEPPLMPNTARERARVRALMQLICCDIHPLQNLRVLQRLQHDFAIGDQYKQEWAQHWIGLGFVALEELLHGHPETGEFCQGDTPTLADCCLVPQVYNAHRYAVDMSAFPTIERIYQHCMKLAPFIAASPEMQPDAQPQR
jgi:maleylacetoacetate isomerase